MSKEWLFKASEQRFEWLNDHAKGWQFGEQGVLWTMCQLGCVPERAAYEIGAGDGVSLPLTTEPQYRNRYRTVLYEIEEARRCSLRDKFPEALVRGSFGEPDTGMDDALVVIDVDSYDVRIMQSILRDDIYPAVMMVEHYDLCGPYMGKEKPTDADVPDWMLGMTIEAGGFKIQATAARLQHIASNYDYTLVGTSRVNSIFIHNRYVNKLER